MQTGDSVDIARRIVERLGANGGTMATAESCSGGLIAHLLTNVSGASQVFVGGVVAYSNEVKVSALDVPLKTLEAHGAVSELTKLRLSEGDRAKITLDAKKFLVRFHSGLTQPAEDVWEEGKYYYIKYGRRTYPVPKRLVKAVEEPG